jgi:peptide/nickel transport system substrate-binding protein
MFGSRFSKRLGVAAALGVGLVLAVGILAASLGGCTRKDVRPADYNDPHPIPSGASRREVEGRHGGRMIFVTIGDPKTFDPVIANEVSSTEILDGPVFIGLTRFANAPQTVEPGLASSWDRSEDALTYTFHLRPGLRWSDGEILDADDVIFTAKVHLDPKIHAAALDILQSGGKPWKFEKVDSLTVRVLLPAPFGPVPEVIGSMYVVPEHKLGQAYKEGRFEEMWDVNTPPAEIVSNGPFVIKEYVPGEKVVLARNPHYWEVDKAGRRLPYLDEFVYLIVKDLNTMALKFESGDIDLIDPIAVDQVPTFEDGQDRGAYKIFDMGPDVATDFMWFNLNPGRDAKGRPFVEPYKLKIFQDVRFRRAISHGINREGIVKSVLQGRGVPLYEPITRANKRWFSPNVPKFEYDPAKAKALLDEMGLVDRNGDGIRENSQGKPVEFTLHTNSENNLRKSFGTVIAENLKNIGVGVNFQPLEFNTMITHIRTDHQYEACLLGLTGGVPPDPALSANVYRSSGLTHQWHPEQKSPATPAEAEIDRLMDVVVAEADYEKRKVAFDRVQEIMGEQQFAIYVVNRNLYFAVRDRIQGVNPSILRPHAIWNLPELWMKDGGRRLAAR